MRKRPVVLYARISVSTEESVSVARQIASGRKYAAARGWRLVGEFIDDGVSASPNKPEDRPGWRSLMGSLVPFEAVIVWKVDRLARRVIDFLHADQTLQARGAAIVCVEQSIDMTTGEGRAFAQMLAVFGEMEAAAISSRITAAREQLIAEGRVPGGRQPFGWRAVPNPHGPGYVRAQDPDRIEWVRGMVDRVLRGDTVYSVMAWLNEAGAPGRRTRREGHPWCYTAVSFILRNPVLVGMFPINARSGYDVNGWPDVRRNADGEPVTAGDGIISMEQYEALLHAITHKAHWSGGPQTTRAPSSPLLARLVTCSACHRPMERHPTNGKPAFWCRSCGQSVKMAALIDLVVRRLLAERGTQRMYRRVLDVPDDPAATRRLAAIDHALRRAALALTEDRTEADAHGLNEEIARLKRARLVARRKVGTVAVERFVYVGTVRQVWGLCVDDQQRHDVLAAQIETLDISKPTTPGGGWFKPSRVHLIWDTNSKPLVPEAITVGPIQRRIRDRGPWISTRDAYRLVGSTESLIRNGIKSGEIVQRKVHRMYPSLDRASVAAFLRDRSPA
jgi:DNA invertase Pin-like site-specific DNA recombinase